MYILYRLLVKNDGKDYIGTEYTEHREYIKNENKKKRRLFGDRYPRNPRDQIRYYYRKYLEKLEKGDIAILKQDTSYKINQKARDSFGSEVDDIRNLYIESRYGNEDVSRETVETMKGLYKKL